MTFYENMKNLQRNYPEAYEDTDNYTKALEKLAENYKYRGAYFIDETGFFRGDASDDDIITDCKNILGIDVDIEDEDAIYEAEHSLYEELNNKFLSLYENELIEAEKRHDEELREEIAQTKTKFIRITDMTWDNWNSEYKSVQLDIIKENNEEVWNDGMLQDNGGDPDGCIWCVYYVNYDKESIDKVIGAGAEIIEMYKADYDQQIKEDLEDVVKDDWTGYAADNYAWFINLDDAVECQKLYNNWYAKEYEL